MASMPQKWLLFPFSVLLLSIFPSRPCFCRLCFDFGQNVKERWSNNQGNLFFIRFFFNVCANRMQSDESWLSRATLRCSLTSPKAKIQHEYPVLQIFSLPNIAPRKFATPLNRHSVLYLRAFLRIFHTRKKMKSGYNFLSHADAQNVRSSHVLPPPNATPTPFCY